MWLDLQNIRWLDIVKVLWYDLQEVWWYDLVWVLRDLHSSLWQDFVKFLCYMTLDRFIYWTLPGWRFATWPWVRKTTKGFKQDHDVICFYFKYKALLLDLVKVLWPWPSGDSMTQACLRCYNMIFIKGLWLDFEKFL